MSYVHVFFAGVATASLVWAFFHTKLRNAASLLKNDLAIAEHKAQALAGELKKIKR